jgi:hypothetical protein
VPVSGQFLGRLKSVDVNADNSPSNNGSRKNSAGSVRASDDNNEKFGVPRAQPQPDNGLNLGIAGMNRTEDNVADCNSYRYDEDDVMIRVRVRKSAKGNPGTASPARGSSPNSPDASPMLAEPPAIASGVAAAESNVSISSSPRGSV